jgi:hypothetical protein
MLPADLFRVRTHTVTDTSGISLRFGTVQDDVALVNAEVDLKEMRKEWGGKIYRLILTCVQLPRLLLAAQKL